MTSFEEETRCGWGKSGTCYGCQWVCNCVGERNKVCELAVSSSCFSGSLAADPPRNKYTCLDCKLVWKSALTKWDLYGYGLSKKKQQAIYKSNKLPTCRQCGKPGIRTGRNFRHCKTDKEWIKLKKDVEEKKIDLYYDFDFIRSKKVSGKELPTNPYGIKVIR